MDCSTPGKPFSVHRGLLITGEGAGAGVSNTVLLTEKENNSMSMVMNANCLPSSVLGDNEGADTQLLKSQKFTSSFDQQDPGQASLSEALNNFD